MLESIWTVLSERHSLCMSSGGVYYIISRSLGPEFGASVGVIFAFANAVAASMNTIGFCDSLNQLLNEYGVKIVDGGLMDVRIVGTVAVFVMIIICAVGMEWESKVSREDTSIYQGPSLYYNCKFRNKNKARFYY